MRVTRFAIFIAFLMLQQYGMAQLPAIQTDRPDQTECPFITPRHFIQVENGFLFEKSKDGTRTYTYPSSLWKYGINERFELRLITEFTTIKQGNKTYNGLAPITLGFKANLLKEKGIVPATSFIGHLTTSSAGSKNLHTSFAAPSFRFVMQHTLNQKTSLSYNLGAEWDGESAAPTYIYTLTSGRAITSTLGGYIELYGYLNKTDWADHRFDGGLTYLVTDHLLLDVSAGLGITKRTLDNYFALGLSYRFKLGK